ncbi:MAG: hypothetical protein U1E61_19500 [Bradyrhizobium sp.]
MSMHQRIAAIIARTRAVIGAVADPYRPERHYMRGPGPKWRARHGLTG